MPGLLVMFSGLMEKTEHRNFVPKIDAVGAFFQMEKVDFVGHDLRHVLVFADNHDMVEACVDSGFGGACHHVIGFVARFRQKRDAARFH